jgi:hypothetical protein
MSMVDELSGKPVTQGGYGLGIYQRTIHNEEVWRHNGRIINSYAGMVWLKCRDISIAFTSVSGPDNGSPDVYNADWILQEIISYIQKSDPTMECQLPQLAH